MKTFVEMMAEIFNSSGQAFSLQTIQQFYIRLTIHCTWSVHCEFALVQEALVDPGRGAGDDSRSDFFYFYAVFSKILQKIGFHPPPLGLAPPA